MGPIYINFFGLSIVIGALFYLLVCAFVFLSIPDRSRSTLHLGLGYLYSGLFILAFLPAHAWYDSHAAFHRWLSVPAALLVHPHYAQIFFHFPDTKYRRTAYISLLVQYAAALGLSVFFYVETFHASRIYSFRGHLWDFDAEGPTRLVALLVALNSVYLIVVGGRHIAVRKQKRIAIAAILLCMIFAGVVPAATNILSRNGTISRDVHQTFLVLMSLLGLFSALLIYFNNTTDRTTFMGKIVGVSLVTLMVVMVFVTYHSFQEQEIAYDQVRREQTSRLTVDRDYPIEDLEYLACYDLNEGTFQVQRGETQMQQTDLARRHREFVDTAAAEEIERLPTVDFRPAISKYALSLPLGLTVARTMIQQHLQNGLPSGDADLRSRILNVFAYRHIRGARYYRSAGDRRYVVFMEYSPSGRVYEAGFSYAAYRQQIHQTGLILGLIFLGVVLAVLVGFRFFFLGSLVRPLDRLLEGVRQVNDGRMDIEVPVAVSDEIGFLTRSFNGMVASIREARVRLQQYAENLESRVRERTAELQNTLTRVQELKHQQDADYFLTLLLIKPLTANDSTSDTVDVEYLMRQKKRFAFRKWKEEIGGDFCSSHSILLRGRPHTVFLNADAMGKSLQGAGGALVLGAVFESLMERSKNMPVLKEQTPERWIKNAFQELQGVFESFDGSMLCSMALGVIDDASGLLYYVNVEHPFGVLYRNGKAGFFEDEVMFRKLGIAGLRSQLRVLTLQLIPGDVLILGSDGRDDIAIQPEAPGKRYINEDETLFPRVVEEAGAQLDEIARRLQEIGELTDDLSLMRIVYRAEAATEAGNMDQKQASAMRRESLVLISQGKIDEAEENLNKALELDPNYLPALRSIIRLHLDRREYQSALRFVEQLIAQQPGDTQMIALAAALCKRLKRYEEAIDHGERVRLREPCLVRNLITLGEAYAAVENYSRATKMLDRALDLENTGSGSDRARKLHLKVAAVSKRLYCP
ncbi:MAG: SpoIIE family protein phosphatase [Leptospirales bacterium]|nr:SpoIIE family protein phosphatase [Leptospirales bacterium]